MARMVSNGNLRRCEMVRAIEAELITLGATFKGVDATARHPIVLFEVEGRVRKYHIPSTPSCVRAIRNNVSGVRRMVRETRERVLHG